jgi:hypothetical protein
MLTAIDIQSQAPTLTMWPEAGIQLHNSSRIGAKKKHGIKFHDIQYRCHVVW